MGLKQCRVVLIRPHIAANLGAVARVMRNMGLADLVLVAPECDPLDPRARQLSTHGEAILHQARVVADFGSAVADCILVAGTSARTGGLFRRQSLGTPDDIMPALVDDPHLPKAIANLSRSLARVDRILGGGEADLTVAWRCQWCG